MWLLHLWAQPHAIVLPAAAPQLPSGRPAACSDRHDYPRLPTSPCRPCCQSRATLRAHPPVLSAAA
jgi:hypothetical protein